MALPAAGPRPPRTRRPSLVVEIGVSLALLTVLVSILDAGVFFLASRSVMEGSVVELARRTATVVSAELYAADEEDWKRVVDAHRRGGLEELAAWTPEGKLVAGESPLAEGNPSVMQTIATREVSLQNEAGHVRVLAPVGEGRPKGVVELRFPLAAAAKPAWVAVGAHAVFSAVVIVVFGLLLFRRNLLVPLRRISVATEAIAGGQFDTPVPGDAPAELASLADSLTTMGTALSAYRTRTADQIAALGRTNAELALAQDALVRTEKLAGVGRLAAGLAHEFGNPLAAVRGYLELLAANPGSPDAADIASRAHVETERMHRLLRNLLDYARADEAEPGNVNLVELLDEAARTVRHQVTFRNRDVTVKITEVPAVRGEAPKLHQVLVNLLLNAADAGAGRIQLSAVGEGRQVVVQVADDGEGIPTANLPKLFEPFFTTRPPGHGTGLGLAIAHRIVEQHGGTIEVKSSPGVGTVFTIRLPVAR